MDPVGSLFVANVGIAGNACFKPMTSPSKIDAGDRGVLLNRFLQKSTSDNQGVYV
jgi:hypothetical protein